MNRLTDWFGIGGNALSWLNSYLRDRFQCININGTISNPFELLFGVPQGSVLGPLLFIMYTTPLSSVFSKFPNLNHHLYADDTQVYNSFTTSNCNSNLTNLQNSLLSAQNWMYSNKLKLNPDKTEFMLIGSKRHRQKFDSKFPLNLIGSKLSPTPTARNLGVIFDQDFNFQNHINGVVKNCFYHMRDLRRIRKHLDIDTATALANALVSSRIDYCNSLLYSLPNIHVQKLQQVQNALARVVTNSSCYTSASQLLEQLHWLPVRSRINFKVGLIVYKALHFEQPTSLKNLISVFSSPFNLRSTSSLKLNHGPNFKSFGSRAFSSFAPKVWNKLPALVRQAPSISIFRKKLKTHYFTHPP